MAWGSNLFPLLIITSGGGFTGLFVYSPHPGAGKLVASITSQAGTDPFGNAYLAGETTYNAGPPATALQNGAGGLIWYTAPTEAGPWTAVANLADTSFAGGPNGVVLQAGFLMLSTAPNAIVPGLELAAILAPSGDTTGATDAHNLNTLLSAPLGMVQLLPGTFYINAPIIINNNGTTLQGANYGGGTKINCAATSPITGMIIAGSTAAGVEGVTIRDLFLTGNANSGHGLISRIEIGLIENVTANSVSGDAFHFSWDGLATTNLDSLVVTNCYAQFPGARGFFADQFLTSSEFYACHAQGGSSSTFAGTIGIHAQGKALKFLNCHAFFFTDQGLFLDGASNCQVDGGEYETCGAAYIQATGATYCRISGAATYRVAGAAIGRDIELSASCEFVTVEACQVNGGNTAGVEVSNCAQCRISGNMINAASSTYAIVLDAGPPASFGIVICDNIIVGPGTGANVINLGGGGSCIVNANLIRSADNILEGAGGNFNIFTSNLTSGAITTVGASTVVANNIV